MKKIFAIVCALAALAGCKKYELNPEFSLPTELSCPGAVTLDVSSSQTVVLSWKPGVAADGGVVLYEVLFDKAGADFSAPVEVLPSDRMADPRLTLTHAALNTIARKAGIAPDASGTIIWTVKASKGANSKMMDTYESIVVTRGTGIDNMPEKLFVNGNAALEAGQAFRQAAEGEYVIVTKLGAGKLRFTDAADGGRVLHADASGKIVDGEGDYTVTAAPGSGIARITVSLNTLSLKIEEIEAQIHAFWNITGADFLLLDYDGKGEFSGVAPIDFEPQKQSWGIEERYGFRLEVDGQLTRWGSNFDNGGVCLPNGQDSFWYVYDQGAETSQWDFLWKMDHALDQQNVKISVFTNKDGHFTHSVESAGAIVYDQPTTTPSALFMGGAAAETDGQAFRKLGDKFVAYAKLKAGELRFRDADGTQYFLEENKDLYIGKKKSISVEASEGVTRVTVDFASKKASFEQISAQVDLVMGWTQQPALSLTYQSNGSFAGEGHLNFLQVGWEEERYYFWLTVDGAPKCWGRLDGVDDQNRPDGGQAANYFHIGEFDRDQWSHLWKLASALNNADVAVTINTNDEGNFTHSFLKLSTDPFPPTVAPSALTLSGSGAEVEGQAFRKASDGVFVIYSKLKAGEISFKGDGKTFFQGDSGLLQGNGSKSVSASSGNATRITVNFKDNSVSMESVDKVRVIWGCCFGDIVTMNYSGAGVWSGSGTIQFVQPGDPRCSWLSWVEERYYFTVTIDGNESVCWGRLDGVDAENRPDGGQAANYYECGEFGWSQWDHLWKMPSAADGAVATITMNTNDGGVMKHAIQF